MQIPSGFLTDWLGAKRLFLIGLLGTNLLSFNLAQLHQYPLILANQTISGVFRSLLFAPGLVLIASFFPRDRRATAIGLFVVGGFSSNIFLNAFGPILVEPLGWRGLFMGFSGAGFLVLLLLWRFGANGPLGYGKEALSISAIVRLFSYRLMWLVAGVQFVRLALAGGFAFWLPTLIVLDKHESLKVAGLSWRWGLRRPLHRISLAATSPTD